MNTNQNVLTPAELLKNFKDCRDLTRQIIERFPEKELFSFSVAKMRPFSEMVKEFIKIIDSVFREKFKNEYQSVFKEDEFPITKSELLNLWDALTSVIDEQWIKVTYFLENCTIYELTFSFAQWVLYMIENETHHRGQGYIYLRMLNIEPPFFWNRESYKK